VEEELGIGLAGEALGAGRGGEVSPQAPVELGRRAGEPARLGLEDREGEEVGLHRTRRRAFHLQGRHPLAPSPAV